MRMRRVKNSASSLVSSNLEFALEYGSLGWRVLPLHGIHRGACTCQKGVSCPSPGKHPRIKTGRAFAAATTDRAQLAEWWRRWPGANIGIATGQASGVVVVDIDGPEGAALLASIVAAHGGLPPTLMSASGRAGAGIHLWFACAEPSPSNSGGKLDIRGDGGQVVVAPSMHASGRAYQWLNWGHPLAPMPRWLLDWFKNRDGSAREKPVNTALPDHLRGRPSRGLLQRAIAQDREPVETEAIASALAVIPNNDRSWDEFNRIGMAIWASCDGAAEGEELFEAWAQKSKKYQPGAAAERWRAYAGTPPDSLSFGSLVYEAKQADPAWSQPGYIVESVPQDNLIVQQVKPEINGHNLNGQHLNGEVGPTASLFTAKNPDNPLIEMNNMLSVIGNVGGRVLVMEWIASPADENLKIPSFQTFKSISERFSHRYVRVATEKKSRTGESELVEESKQLGAFWLKWTGRNHYERLELNPEGPPVMPGNILNLWKGFGVDPKAGAWPLMQQHIFEVLAAGDAASAAYIFRWAAWAVQKPAIPAEVALVFRGEKGAGKGTFGHALRKLFGQHGLHISNAKHMVGQFNGHLRNCILLLADEAFWAGDKQGESTLKAMLTEPSLMIEQKGVDAIPWKNRLHVVMLANSEWAVPASAKERRYAVFDVAETKAQNEKYFDALRHELDNGGLEAMLHDLKALDIQDWHPRRVIQTTGLQVQKARSLEPLADWYVAMLQDGYMPGGRAGKVPASTLLHIARESTGKLRDLSAQGLGRFLKKHGLKQVHGAQGQFWNFPELCELRGEWEKSFGVWSWEEPGLKGWRTRA